MSRPVRRHRAFVRPMQGWWRRDPYFMRYMLREATAFAVLAYAVTLAAGIARLAQGEAAWNGWLAAMRSPVSILLHVVLLAAMLVHARSWFDIMPRTMPMLFVRGRRVAARTITRAGYALAIAAFVLLAATAWWLRS